MSISPTLTDLMADPGELDVSCLDCHHNTTMPVAALLPRYAAETPFPEVWGGFRCSACDRGGLTFDPTGRSPDGWADNSAIGVEPAGTFRRAVFRKSASAAPPWLAGHSP
jgi:hypothetical protein